MRKQDIKETQVKFIKVLKRPTSTEAAQIKTRGTIETKEAKDLNDLSRRGGSTCIPLK